MKPKKFLILAHHRSGTLYASMAFEGIGLHVSHEKDEEHVKSIYGIDTYYDGVVSGVFQNVSEDFSKYDIILHQVRHPIDVISSSYNCGGRIANTNIKKYGDGIKPKTSIEKHMKSWLAFTDMADSVAHYTYRLENLQREFGHICNNILGIEKPVKFRSLMQKYNYRKHFTFSWTEFELFNPEMAERIKQKAIKYGYTLDEILNRAKSRLELESTNE